MDLDVLVASLLAGHHHLPSADAVAATWRFAGVTSLDEVRAWMSVGVFDGHRAGLLRIAGVEPHQLAAIPDGTRLGFAFAMGELSVTAVWNAILAADEARSGDTFTGATTLVRERPPEIATLPARTSERSALIRMRSFLEADTNGASAGASLEEECANAAATRRGDPESGADA